MGEKKRKKRRRKLLRRMLLGIGAGALAVLLFLAVFQTRHIEVAGNNRYTEDEIRALIRQQPLAFNTVLLTYFPYRKDFSGIPFLESMSCEMVSVSTVRVTVEEKTAVGYVTAMGQKAYFDGSGIVLECIPQEEENSTEENTLEVETDPNVQETPDGGEETPEVLTPERLPSAKVETGEFQPELENIPLVTGLGEESIEPGEQLKADDPEIFRDLEALAKQLDRFDLWPDQVEIGEGRELTLHYGSSVRVLLGSSAYMEEKITKLSKILPMLDGLSGQLDLQDVDERNTDVVFVQDVSAEDENGGEDPLAAGEKDTGEALQPQ